jgi:hypothetical protein
MRLMWLWVLIYAFGAGFILTVWLLFTGLGSGHYPVSDVFSKIWEISFIIAITALFCGFWVLTAGWILLLIPRKFSAGRVVSLTGIGLYYLAVLGHILAGITSGDPTFGGVNAGFLVALIGLPGFFIIRQSRRLQAGSIET